MTTFQVSPEYREGVLYGVRMPLDIYSMRKQYDQALAQARKDALPFEDQEEAKWLLGDALWNSEGNAIEGLYSSLSWEVSEVEISIGAVQSGFSDNIAAEIIQYKKVLRIVTKP